MRARAKISKKNEGGNDNLDNGGDKGETEL
jgi:hypothetical protein